MILVIFPPASYGHDSCHHSLARRYHRAKVGLSWHDDLLQLHKRAAFKAGYFIELQDVAKNFGIADMSLQKLYANLFHQKSARRNG